MIDNLPSKEKRKVFATDNDLFDNIRIIINKGEKKRSKEFIKIISSERKFFPSEDLIIKIIKELSDYSDNEIGDIYISLYNRLLKKHDPLVEKLKNNIYSLIKERLEITNEVQKIFDEKNLQLLRTLILNTNNSYQEAGQIVKDNKEISKLNHPFLLFTLFYQYNRSIDFESILWNFLIIVSIDRNKKIPIKFKEPQREIYDQIHSILKRKNGIRQVKKYFKTIGPYYESYLKIKTENNANEEKIFIEKQQNLQNKQEIVQLKSNIVSLQSHIEKLEKQIEGIQAELEIKTKDYEINLEDQKERDKEIFSMNIKSLYNNIKKDIQFCFNEIKIGLSRDTETVTRENINLLLNRIRKIRKFSKGDW